MAPAGSAGQSTAEMASNTLWEYQLRKENKAILDQIRKIGEKRDADVAENMKRMQEGEKRRLALEAKVVELEKEHKLQEARAAEHKKECTAKLAEMEKFLSSRLTDDELRKIFSSSPQTSVAAPRAIDPQPSRIAPRPSNPRLNGEDGRVRAADKPTPPIREEVPAPRPKQVANRRPSTRSNPGGIAPAIPPKAAQSTIPKLAQKRKTLPQYYEIANAAFESMRITDPQIEYDFIATFIAGLESKKAQEKVTQALTAVHPARGRLDGGVEIMCGWEDVAAGLKRAGFDITGAKEEIKRKKRTLNPRTQLETGFAN